MIGRRAAALLVIACAAATTAGAAPDGGLCRPVSHEEDGYVVCTVDLRREAIRLFWKGPDGEPYGGLRRLADSPAGRQLLAATNAGMYEHDLSPVGLYVEGGRELKRANTANAEGNFHLKPNGIFYVGRAGAGILETGAYLKRRPEAEFATQSGPMLVIDGRLHPRITADGPSRKVRNGVGVRDAQTVYLAISDGPVSFGAFARLFRDKLGCRDALFLDGSVSSLWAPGIAGRQGFLPIGPILGVFPR